MINLGIRYKLLISFLFMALFILLSGCYSLFNLNDIKKNFIEVVDSSVPRLQALLEMQTLSSQISYFIFSFNPKNNRLTSQQIDQYKNELLAYFGSIDYWQKEYEIHASKKNDSLNNEDFKKLRNDIILIALDTFSAMTKNDPQIISIKKNSLNNAQITFNNLITQAVEAESSNLDKQKNNTLNFINTIYYVFLLTNGIIIFIAIFISFFMTYLISKPIIHLKNFAQKINLNNLNKRIEIKTKDELGELANSMNYMLEQLATTKSELIAMSREAGLSEIATSILHNIGNVVNSMNISLHTIKKDIEKNEIISLQKIIALFKDNLGHLETYLKNDEKGKYAIPYLETIIGNIKDNHDHILKELEDFTVHVQHIINVIHMQQNVNKTQGVIENISLNDLLDEASIFHKKEIAEYNISIEKEYANLPKINSIKAKLQQIIINLFKNAIEALMENPNANKKIILKSWKNDTMVCVSVTDNGIGVEQENIIKIFNFGFTTKKEGHGYGLHHSANLAKELKGQLIANSQGKGKGTTFTLNIPLK